MSAKGDGTLYLNSTSNMDLYSSTTMFMGVDSSNAFVRLNGATDTVEISGYSNVQTTATLGSVVTSAGDGVFSTAGQNAWFTACNDTHISGSNDVYVVAKNTLTLSAGNVGFNAAGFGFTADSNIDFRILSSSEPQDPILSISSNTVQIRGNLVLTGEMSTSNILSTTVVQKTLKVSDKIVKIANVGTGSNEFDPVDGFLTNDSSGLVIDGFPDMGSNVGLSNAYGKALMWHYGDDPNNSMGVTGLGTSNIVKESYWEMTGGSFRLTHKKVVDANTNTIRDLSFGFRINENDELELVKKFWDNTLSEYKYKRIARFGRII